MRRLICRIGCCILFSLAVVAPMSCEAGKIPKEKLEEVGIPPEKLEMEVVGPIMATYEGPTATISGKVIFEGYEKDPIIVFVNSEGHVGPPDITFVEIPKPGKYTLEVPANVGNINLSSMNIRLGDRPRADTPAGGYEENPLKVGSSNIEGINIVISRR